VALPEPVPGLVIRYSYLWADEYKRGQEEGAKDRPCAIVMARIDRVGERIVLVLPVTHTPPGDPAFAIEIPQATKRRLRLDDARSWVILNEVNRLRWPGPDLRPATPGDVASVAYGQLPYALFEEIRLKFMATVRAARAGVVPRSE
jgi:hypothetical protein